jgi:ubiquinone/menaquinone biosynthesis C-methylase UbiE
MSLVYRFLIDPLLFSAHNCAASLVQKGEKVLDVACGNGTLTLLIEQTTGNRVTGIDIDPDMLAAAMNAVKRKKKSRARFMLMDATNLSAFAEKEFDVAIISLAMHQFNPFDGLKVLKEIIRVANKVIVVDYGWPMKAGFFWWMTRLIERIAGGDHYRNFKSYMQNGGIDPLLRETGLNVKQRFLKGKGTLMVSLCERGN